MPEDFVCFIGRLLARNDGDRLRNTIENCLSDHEFLVLRFAEDLPPGLPSTKALTRKMHLDPSDLYSLSTEHSLSDEQIRYTLDFLRRPGLVTLVGVDWQVSPHLLPLADDGCLTREVCWARFS